MLTGDKLETALCIAKSLHLVDGASHNVFEFARCTNRIDANAEINRLNSEGSNMVLIIEGDNFEVINFLSVKKILNY